MTKFLAALVLLMLLTGCTTFDRAVLADSATTYAGLSKGARELNPMFGQDPVTVAIGATVVSYGYRHVVKSWFTPATCISAMHTFSAMKFGAAANNLMIIAGTSSNAAKVVGLAVGYLIYKNLEPDTSVCD